LLVIGGEFRTEHVLWLLDLCFIVVGEDLGRLQNVEELLVVHVFELVEVVLEALLGWHTLVLLNICAWVRCVVEDLDEVGDWYVFKVWSLCRGNLVFL